MDADPEKGILLLEQLRPGTPLSHLKNDRQATSITVNVMRQLWRSVPKEHSFPTTAKWASGLQRLRAHFNGGTGPFPPDLIETAEALFTDLHDSMAAPVLLHGDLHYLNILSDSSTSRRHPWLAIDPKGVVGEPAYEVGALLRNPWPHLLEQPDPAQILSRRIDQLAEELGFDRQRLLMWGTSQAVLSAWWSYEDHGHGWEYGIEVARILQSIENSSTLRE